MKNGSLEENILTWRRFRIVWDLFEITADHVHYPDTLFTELFNSPNGQNYTHFILLKHFKFDLDGGTESITQTDVSVSLYSANFETVNFNINSI